MNQEILVFQDSAALWSTVTRELELAVRKATTERVGVLCAGGTTYLPFYAQAAPNLPLDLFPTDEHLVEPGTAEDTGQLLLKHWQARFADPQVHVYPVVQLEDPDQTANSWERSLQEWVGQHSWAAALLGVGLDGHTASLFPGQRDHWEQTGQWAVSAHPEQPPWVPRVTLTPTFFRQVPTHIVVLTGQKKADIAKRWLTGAARDLPIAALEPREKRLVLLDTAAASELPENLYRQV